MACCIRLDCRSMPSILWPVSHPAEPAAVMRLEIRVDTVLIDLASSSWDGPLHSFCNQWVKSRAYSPTPGPLLRGTQLPYSLDSSSFMVTFGAVTRLDMTVRRQAQALFRSREPRVEGGLPTNGSAQIVFGIPIGHKFRIHHQFRTGHWMENISLA
ncbi:hypothetical protein BDP55DRAFT_626972 [Colletotrichum godetiae]|uniref:Uncharacterized protein n=1 Tax=Colletotrichum godetiae TaxID=1209918 RepID=A0AAJ0AVS8_9PEZI|nr:uncharacterized protein BDP55DRAFT_626972 [Colletotrichum godetiae]KAK1691296.1 hypothetical protein BDP55DRAFT_626972 [Colletotrichum godetiae]